MKLTAINDINCVTPFLVRLTLIELFGWTLKLHIFLRDDHDLHDHPWKFWTWLIAGSYREEVTCESAFNAEGKAFADVRITVTGDGTHPSGARISYHIERKPGSLAFRPAKWVHRVLLIDKKPCATLILTAPVEREWGFTKGSRWIPWRQYNPERHDC